jgi:hypothetical protein
MRSKQKTTCLLERAWARWQMPFRKAVITGLLCEPVWSCLKEKLKCLKYVHTVENGFEVYAYAESGLREAGWQKLFPGAKVQLVFGSWEDNSRYRMLHAQGLFITLGTPQRKEVLADRRKDMPLTKSLRDEGSNGSDDSADERERKRAKQEDDRSWLLTSRNLERASLRYRSEHGIESDRLEDTLAAMCTDSAEPWRLNKELQREIPQTFFEQFTAVCHGRTIYTAEFFAGLRRA